MMVTETNSIREKLVPIVEHIKILYDGNFVGESVNQVSYFVQYKGDLLTNLNLNANFSLLVD